jgi:hypothetical protein
MRGVAGADIYWARRCSTAGPPPENSLETYLLDLPQLEKK